MVSRAFDGFFDDAAIFPPGNAPLDVAVKAYLSRAASPDGRYVGPFVVDAARLPDLNDLGEESFDLAVVNGAIESRPDGRAIEQPWGTGFEVADGDLLKLRCGGDYVPTVAELAEAIRWCVAHDQPFKLTAGLHAAIATEHTHGFVNIMAAVVTAMHDEDPGPVLMAWADELDLETLGDSRRLFRSIGTCDIDGPLAELRELGLIP